MVEKVYQIFTEYSFPSLVSSIVQAIEELGEEQDPPFSHGNYFIEIRGKFLTFSWSHRVFYNDMMEPIFAMAARLGYFYIDENFAKFSTRRLNDNFRTYQENIALKWPGYELGRSGHIICTTDHLVHLDDLYALMKSKDIDRYEREKDYFFGSNARYSTGNSS